MAFYFVRWFPSGQEPKGSQTFNTLRAVRSYARRARYAHPTWGYQIVRHEQGEQTVIEPPVCADCAPWPCTFERSRA